MRNQRLCRMIYKLKEESVFKSRSSICPWKPVTVDEICCACIVQVLSALRTTTASYVTKTT